MRYASVLVGYSESGVSAQKELKEIQKAAEKQGWRIKSLKSGHKMYLAPDGVNKVTAPGTPGGGRGMDNLLSELRRYGFEWKGH
jgi:predicted RNA binding protein YcfA (HicA-like mRNA interferase family)